MIDWSQARKLVADTFFGDEVEIYPLEEETDDIGESSKVLGDSLGKFSCNIQYTPIGMDSRTSGLVNPQTGRVSTEKTLPLERGKEYALKITKARVQFDPEEMWGIPEWVEGQISTVLTIKRREIV